MNMKLPMPMTATQIAGFIGGKVEGDGNTPVTEIAVNPLTSTQNDIALVTSPHLIKKLNEIKAKIVIVPQGTKQVNDGQVFICVERPKLGYSKNM